MIHFHPTLNGFINILNNDKGYGFIESENTNFFFHKSAFEEDWEDMWKDYLNGIKINVEFDNGYSPKGPRAEKVRRII